ncbi:hypothetical protein MWU52_11850 [Jannaschia sp. S6380]|uniref:hypothetical protein n=1 Tax=Jannaschia sp. S6380 TaxID=2926408 RepID=UPI001FF21575|nr:hypothetical protein [Jannaschia sp. S6380]MCK0168249.1 hypothetical protein [Jannaschia sp. S6380]
MTYLPLLSDLLLVCATVAVAIWCRALSRRPDDTSSDDLASAATIAALAKQVEDLQAAIRANASEEDDHAARLRAETDRADDRIGRMEMLLSSLESLEEDATARLMETPDEVDAAPRMPSFRDLRVAQVGGGQA